MTADPAWLDDPALTVSIAEMRALLAHHAATERAEGRTPPPAVEPAREPRSRRRGAAAGQASFLAPVETVTDGQYSQETALLRKVSRKARA